MRRKCWISRQNQDFSELYPMHFPAVPVDILYPSATQFALGEAVSGRAQAQASFDWLHSPDRYQVRRQDCLPQAKTFDHRPATAAWIEVGGLSPNGVATNSRLSLGKARHASASSIRMALPSGMKTLLEAGPWVDVRERLGQVPRQRRIVHMTEAAHYEFGNNWADYASTAGDTQLAGADAGVRKLLPEGIDPAGKSFLDIGSGSGLHAVAAARMGFKVTATDYDPMSVETTKRVASRFGVQVNAFRDDILNTALTGTYDVVYSWGVLHHTGNMRKAIETAASLVAPGGTFIIAIYLRTPLCGFWRVEKRIYSVLPKFMQTAGAYAFRGFAIALRAVDKNEERVRGMDWFHDARDWLGGYPYESAGQEAVVKLVGTDFDLVRSFNTVPGRGILGSGCGEYVFRRR